MVPLLTSCILEPGEGRVEQVRGECRHHAAEEYLNKKTKQINRSKERDRKKEETFSIANSRQPIGKKERECLFVFEKERT